MKKLLSAAISAVLVTGCASHPTGPAINTYSYESAAHSGSVEVHEKIYSSKHTYCPATWRNAPQHQPKGIPAEYETGMKVGIEVVSPDAEDLKLSIGIPSMLESEIVVRDLQKHREFAINADSHGLITQGEHFFFPEGYFVRVGHVEIDRWITKGCIAIDRTYVPESELNSGNPTIHLDRVVVPYAKNNGGKINVSFGRYNDHKSTIWITP